MSSLTLDVAGLKCSFHSLLRIFLKDLYGLYTYQEKKSMSTNSCGLKVTSVRANSSDSRLNHRNLKQVTLVWQCQVLCLKFFGLP